MDVYVWVCVDNIPHHLRPRPGVNYISLLPLNTPNDHSSHPDPNSKESLSINKDLDNPSKSDHSHDNPWPSLARELARHSERSVPKGIIIISLSLSLSYTHTHRYRPWIVLFYPV